ncbi:uncharacterized protein LOC107270955 isoform X3 [Cephus cinctus]|uniref:Uncharacterized protein LOC107270955 isoform X3 n=1 Tax=Cephus cinctus TaxID=211228 RepID=A0AAJ7RP26_CEPCN|nr:uncharacterized protein LOC107270955 isoform X3 [Cephus cinctus]
MWYEDWRIWEIRMDWPPRSSASIEHKNGNGNGNSNNNANGNGTKTNNNVADVNRNEDQSGPIDPKSQAKKKPNARRRGPLLVQEDVSSSQLDFFKMLDEKIENGPDYDETLDAAATAERVSSLLRRWELASVNWSSVIDLNTSPSNLKSRSPVLSTSRQSLSAKDREGMRNIIGGRPESAPVFVRNANRVDGLQETHCPSPNMPKHVLESITQSPTQSLKNTPPGMSPNSIRCQEFREYKEYKEYKESKGGGGGAGGGGGGGKYQSSQLNGEFMSQQALYREQYLQQTGIVTIPAQYSAGSPGGNVLRNNPYVQQFQIPSPQHFPTPRKRPFNAAQMT